MIRALFIFAFVVLGSLGVYAFWVEPRQLVIRALDIGEGERDIRIALVSDVHVGGLHTSTDRIETLVAALNAQSPDLILIPGDFISGHTARLETAPEQLAEIDRSLATLGALNAKTFATIGNHDVWFDASFVAQTLRNADVTVLQNDAAHYEDLCLVGLADSDTQQPSREPFDDCQDEDIVVALMHSPDARLLLPSHTALGVAGHTHGGQINLPFIGRAVTSTRCGEPCAYGLIQSIPPFYVTSGFGTSMLPMRFRAPPEIVVITLRYPSR